MRMGHDQATLPVGPGEMSIQRVVRLIAEVVPFERIVCVGTVGQSLPALPAHVRIISDEFPYSGPLAALTTGLNALGDEVEVAFATGCDTPLLKPAFIERMFELLGDYTIAAPHDGQHWQPLAAVYRRSALPSAESLLAAGERSLIALLDASNTRRVMLPELRDVDPELQSLAACNTPAEYEAAINLVIPNP